MSDEKHIRGLKEGSHTSFTYLYNKYVASLYHFMCMISDSNDVAKDVVQEVFLRVWINRQNIDESKSFKSFLFTIARNEMLNTLQKKVNQTLLLEDKLHDTPQVGDEIHEQVHLNNMMDSLKAAKSKLPPRQLQLFELNKEQGMSIKEIIALTSLSEQTIRNQLSSALKVLREELGPINLSVYIVILAHVIKHI